MRNSSHSLDSGKASCTVQVCCVYYRITSTFDTEPAQDHRSDVIMRPCHYICGYLIGLISWWLYSSCYKCSCFEHAGQVICSLSTQISHKYLHYFVPPYIKGCKDTQRKDGWPFWGWWRRTAAWFVWNQMIDLLQTIRSRLLCSNRLSRCPFWRTSILTSRCRVSMVMLMNPPNNGENGHIGRRSNAHRNKGDIVIKDPDGADTGTCTNLIESPCQATSCTRTCRNMIISFNTIHVTQGSTTVGNSVFQSFVLTC